MKNGTGSHFSFEGDRKMRPGTIFPRFLFWSLVSCLLAPVSGFPVAEAAVGKGKNKQVESASATQGGGVSTSKFRQQFTVGEAVGAARLVGTRFRILPGFLGAAAAAPTPLVTHLDLVSLTAKTAPLGQPITPKLWQRDRDPIFIWQPPPTGPELAGYSYAIDAEPDSVVDTTGTSFDVATSTLQALADGVHTFSVKALNTLGNAGKPISFEMWVDTVPPQIASFTPEAASLFNKQPTVTATLLEALSGIERGSVELVLNGGTASVAFSPDTGALTSAGGGWQEGTNTLELRAADLAGNALTPFIWTVSLDTVPPRGSVTINAGALMTTSRFVTLGLSAADATSGVRQMQISNQQATGYAEEPFAALRSLWGLNPIRGRQAVFVKFIDRAGNVSAPVADDIELALLAPETIITAGPAGLTPSASASFRFMCPEGGCLFSVAFDTGEWSEWRADTSASASGLSPGNHYFRVKAAKDVNGETGIQPDEEDPTPAERTWIIGLEPPIFIGPKGPPIKVWRLE